MTPIYVHQTPITIKLSHPLSGHVYWLLVEEPARTIWRDQNDKTLPNDFVLGKQTFEVNRAIADAMTPTKSRQWQEEKIVEVLKHFIGHAFEVELWKMPV